MDQPVQPDEKPQRPKKHNHFYASIMAIDPSGKILLGKRKKDGLWTPPAGSSHMHETPMETAIRETFEETGLAVKQHELQPLPTLDTNDRRVCHVFLWMCPPEVSMRPAKSNLDPDHEVEQWVWFDQSEVPLDIHQDENRATSVKNAYMKFYGIKKGGPGSGVQGHTTMHPTEDKVVNLTNKLTNESPFKSHLDKLKNGAIMEGVTLRSGKPLYLSLEQATAHGYTPDDFKEAANIHYEKAHAIAENIQKVKDLKKPVPKEMDGILNFHKRQFRSNMGAAERLSTRMDRTKQAMHASNKMVKPGASNAEPGSGVKKYGFSNDPKIKKSDEQAEAQAQRRLQQLMERRPQLAEKHPDWAAGPQPVEKDANHNFGCASAIDICDNSMKKTTECDCPKCIAMRKSVVMMGHADSAEVDTAKFATEYAASFQSNWADKFYESMKDYKYGELPRMIILDKGTLDLVQVDDGMYTGSFTKDEWVPEANGPGGYMQDTAKVRMERMSIPSLVQFCIAKEWITPHVPSPMDAHSEPQVASLVQALTVPMEESKPPEVPPPTIQERTRVLELLDKLTS